MSVVRPESQCRRGKIRLRGYLKNLMGDSEEALRIAPASPDNSATREYRIQFGVTLDAGEKRSDDRGAFLGWGWDDGPNTFTFSEIALTDRLENIEECYYKIRLAKGLFASEDDPVVENAGDNRDLGPESIWPSHPCGNLRPG
jgi:hypothetical protein